MTGTLRMATDTGHKHGEEERCLHCTGLRMRHQGWPLTQNTRRVRSDASAAWDYGSSGCVEPFPLPLIPFISMSYVLSPTLYDGLSYEALFLDELI